MTEENDWWACMMAGGASSRFFPLNKIFFDPVKIGRTLSQQAYDRICGTFKESSIPGQESDRFVVVTSQSFAPVLYEHLSTVPKSNFIGEPSPRSTLPAILLACNYVRKRNPEGLLCVVTADHIISNVQVFRSTLAAARQIARERPAIVTIGITPSKNAREWTGFGAINSLFSSPVTFTEGSPGLASSSPYHGIPIYPLARFEEKPSLERAQQLIEENNAAASAKSTSSSSFSSSSPLAWTWNAGMFVFKVSTLERALQQFNPILFEKYTKFGKLTSSSVDSPNEFPVFSKEAVETFLSFPTKIPHPLNPSVQVDNSVDYAVMMPLTISSSSSPSSSSYSSSSSPTLPHLLPLTACVIPGAFPWFDVGGWAAFRTVVAIPQDAAANIVYGPASSVVNGTKNCIVVLENVNEDELIVDGLDSYVAILSHAGVLAVIPEAVSQHLKTLKEKTDKTADNVVIAGDPTAESSYTIRCSAGRVCAYNPAGLDITLTKKEGGKGHKALVKKKD